MVIAHNGKGALEERLDPVSPDRDSGPANMLVDAFLVYEKSFPLVDLVVLPLHLFDMPDITVLVHELDVRIMVEDVMVGFKAEPDVFGVFM